MKRTGFLVLILAAACGDSAPAPAPTPAPAAPRYWIWTLEKPEIRDLALRLPEPAAIEGLFELATSPPEVGEMPTLAAMEAQRALARGAGPGATALLAMHLRDGDSRERRVAAQTLGELEWPATGELETLLAAAGSGDRRIGQSASRALVRIGDVAFERLVEALASGDGTLVRAAFATLPGFGTRALPPLRAALGDPDLRSLALEGLAQLGADAAPALPEVRELFTAQYPIDRQRAAAACAAMGEAAAAVVPELRALLDDPSELVRAAAVDALGAIGAPAPETVAAIVARLEDLTERVRRAARRALQAFGPAARDAGPALAKLIERDENTGDALATLDAIDADPAVALPAIRKTLECRRQQTRAQALEAFARVASPEEAAEVLFAAWENDAYVYVRVQAEKLLRSLGPGARSLLPRLLARFDAAEPGGEVHLACERMLGALGSAAAPAIPRLGRDLDQGCYDAALALGRIGGAAAPELKRVVSEGKRPTAATAFAALTNVPGQADWCRERILARLSAPDEAGRRGLLETLARLGPDAAAIAPVSKLLRDPDPGVRAAAVETLGAFGDLAIPAEEAVAARLDDVEGGVRYEAARALDRIGREGPVLDWIERELARHDRQARIEAARLLRNLETADPRRTRLLERAFADPDLQVRRIAAAELDALETGSR